METLIKRAVISCLDALYEPYKSGKFYNIPDTTIENVRDSINTYCTEIHRNDPKQTIPNVDLYAVLAPYQKGVYIKIT